MKDDNLQQRAQDYQDQLEAQRDLDRAAQQVEHPGNRQAQQKLVSQNRDVRLLKENQGQQLAKQQRDQLRAHQQEAQKLFKNQRDQQRVQQLQQAQQRSRQQRGL